ncbi:MAG: C4-dicarboxylate ABC transporter substrate-binding protein, partial [Alphaproteobacteria bacterium]|nr:C4-dicarboxylate ABC transporter substrate-binding protein [Alphaproteobacteria bacterium]
MRKSVLTLGALALGAFTFTSISLPTASQAQMVEGPEVTWRLSLWGKRRAFSEGLEYISAEVAKRTSDKFKIKLYYGGQLSKGKENLDG